MCVRVECLFLREDRGPVPGPYGHGPGPQLTCPHPRIRAFRADPGRTAVAMKTQLVFAALCMLSGAQALDR